MDNYDLIYSSVFFVFLYLCFHVMCIIGFVIFVRFVIRLIRKSTNRSYFKNSVVVIDSKESGSKSSAITKYYTEHRDVTKEQLKMFNTDNIDALKDYLYDIFYRFEQAYNNLDYSTMERLSTKQLFQNYYTGISLDLKFGKKRIIEDVERKKVILYEIDSTVAKQSASLMIEISYINYVVNGNGEIVSGYRNTPITEKFEVEFRKYFKSYETTKCRNCGAVVTGNKCEYCRTTVQEDTFRISAIRKIVEK